MPLILTGTSSSTTLDSSAGLTFSDSSNQSAAASPFGLKNRIINGDMTIDQRNAGASVIQTDGTYTLDRWIGYSSQASKYTTQQNAGSVTPPAGFTNYLGVTSTSAYSIISTDYFGISQKIEGFNTADLNWGSANAKTITISFWVRSSLTGTFGGGLINSAVNRSYPFSYTISAANTWEQKSITITGDTSGTWLTTNGIGIQITFALGYGSTFSGTAGAWVAGQFYSVTGATSVVGTNGATFYITGVQLERNTTATPFEWLPYGTEFALCCRYYQIMAFMGVAVNTGEMAISGGFPVYMRTTPSMNTQVTSGVDGANLGNTLTRIGVGSATVGAATTFFGSIRGVYNIYCSGLTTGAVYVGSTTVSAEL
jgi:hypothetical protein